MKSSAIQSRSDFRGQLRMVPCSAMDKPAERHLAVRDETCDVLIVAEGAHGSAADDVRNLTDFDESGPQQALVVGSHRKVPSPAG